MKIKERERKNKEQELEEPPYRACLPCRGILGYQATNAMEFDEDNDNQFI